MEELFKQYWKEFKAVIKGAKSQQEKTKLAFFHGYNFGYEAARKTALQVIARNSKISKSELDEIIKKLKGN